MQNIIRNFWVLEGLDGAGTTTQLKKIDSYLKTSGKKYYITQEPTTNETGLIIRKVLSGEIKTTQSTIAYMFAADRNDHLYNAEYGILKHVNDNEIVVSDRYLFSSLAYQSIGFDYSTVLELNSHFPLPEVVIFIDTPVEDCIKRIDNRGQKKEIYEKLEYQKKVKKNYEKCFSDLPEEVKVVRISGLLSKEDIFETIKKELSL